MQSGGWTHFVFCLLPLQVKTDSNETNTRIDGRMSVGWMQ
jgi:hypothetical protein